MNFLIEDFNISANAKRSDRHLNRLRDHFIKQIDGAVPTSGFAINKTVFVCEHYKKNVDLVVSGEHFIEFKSISSSFKKNFNNRVEEMVGQCQLLGSFGKVSYVFVYYDKEKGFARYGPLKGMIQRLVSQGLLYSAVLLKVDEESAIEDPDLDMVSFLKRMRAENE